MFTREGITFTTSQKKGIGMLFLLIISGIGGLAFTKYFGRTPSLLNLPPPNRIIAQDNTGRIEPVRLDINLADSIQWVTLKGIGPVLSRRILKFRKAKGGFRSVDEISKVYGLKPEVFQAILPRLYVDTLTVPVRKTQYSTSFPLKKKEKNRRPRPPVIDVNMATASDFAQLPGIGAVLSKRIIKYRDAIGGFQEITQLKKVYQLKPEVFESLQPFLRITPVTATASISGTFKDSVAQTGSQIPVNLPIEPIEVNFADAVQLEALPGIGTKLAPRIIRYRTLIGFFRSVDQIQKVYGFSAENFERARPYLLTQSIPVYTPKDLNMTSAKQLALYPFVGKELANALIVYRKKLGRFESWEEVGQIPGITTEAMKDIKTYYTL